MFLINECTKCPDQNFVGRQKSLCVLEKGEQIEDTANILAWCPLPNVTLAKKPAELEQNHG